MEWGPYGYRAGYRGDAAIEVAEREGAPVVGELVLTNVGESSALLVDGELLEGGWQHRVLEHDIVVAAGRIVVAAVACVEAGRWGGDAGHLRRARRGSPRVRVALGGAVGVDRQQEVWARVGSYDAVLGESPTSSYVDYLEHFEATGITAAGIISEARRLVSLPGQMGVLVGLAGQPLLLELYPTSEALDAHLSEIVISTILDATAQALPAVPVPGRRARRFADRLVGVEIGREAGTDAGEATAVGLDSAYVTARGVVVDEHWAHLSLFNRSHPVLGLV